MVIWIRFAFYRGLHLMNWHSLAQCGIITGAILVLTGVITFLSDSYWGDSVESDSPDWRRAKIQIIISAAANRNGK